MNLSKILNLLIISLGLLKQVAPANKQIKLSEDIKEINAYTKDIFEINGIYYIEIDLVEIKYKNIDERVIVNNNSKLRTYIIDTNTIIYSDNCKRVNPAELLQRKKIILENKSIIIVGQSKKGKMISINFGCYG